MYRLSALALSCAQLLEEVSQIEKTNSDLQARLNIVTEDHRSCASTVETQKSRLSLLQGNQREREGEKERRRKGRRERGRGRGREREGERPRVDALWFIHT